MDRIWLAIHREASLAAEHLAFGATMLGKANYAQQAYYYQAFFALSVGLERSSKLALAVDSGLRDGRFPTDKEMRAYGHRLDTLIEAVGAVATSRGIDAEVPSSEINGAILHVLTDFADNVTRYYNLAALAGGPKVAGVVDPLQAWHEQVFTPVVDAHYGLQKRVVDQANAKVVADLLAGHAAVLHHTETGDVLTDIEAASALMGVTKAIQPWVRMYVLQFARFFYEVMSDLGFAAMQQGRADIPYLSEYYAIYCNDDAYFRSRKVWTIHGM